MSTKHSPRWDDYALKPPQEPGFYWTVTKAGVLSTRSMNWINGFRTWEPSQGRGDQAIMLTATYECDWWGETRCGCPLCKSRLNFSRALREAIEIAK